MPAPPSWTRRVQAVTSDEIKDEVLSHVLRSSVSEATPAERSAWIDDTMDYFTRRYPALTPGELGALRALVERYATPVEAAGGGHTRTRL
jgi:hypothetical protein